MNLIKKFSIIALALVTIIGLNACNKSNGGQGSSKFAGLWLEEQITEFRESKDPNVICKRIEESNGNYELSIDGFNIDASGNVRDFSLYGESQILWKVRSDGSTYDNIYLQLEVEGTEGIESNSMSLKDEDTLVNTWVLKINGNSETNPGVTYLRVSSEEVANLKKIVESCPKK